MTSRGSASRHSSLKLFKVLEAQTITFWSALRSTFSDPRLAAIAKVTGATRKELDGGKLPLDRLECLIPRLGKLFTKKQAARLGGLWHEILKTRDNIFELNVGLISGRVRRYNAQGALDKDDLWQEGACGLVKAIYRFDRARGFQFSTYATHWIRHSIGRAIANKRDLIRLPVYVQERKGPAPRVYQLDIQLLPGVTGTGVNVVGGAGSVYDVVSDDAPSALSQMMDHETYTHLHDCLDKLPPMQRDILERRAGFKGEPQKLAEIGKVYKLSRERIRQIEQAAMATLRDMITIE